MMQMRLTYSDLFKKISLLMTVVMAITFTSHAQGYVVNGSAFANGNSYTLTPNANGQNGSVWSQKRIDLRYDFDLQYSVNLGSNPGGADGMAFVLQNSSNTVQGSSGSGMGYGGISPSLVLEYDSYINSDFQAYDPLYDHMCLMRNGEFHHNIGQLLSPVALTNFTGGSVKDGQPHASRVIWNAASKTMNIYFEGNLKYTYNSDLINNFFGGDPAVYFGFTASTGGLSNQHAVNIDPASSFTEFSNTASSLTLGSVVLSDPCAGLNNGSATINFSGGSAPYTITLDNNSATSILTSATSATFNNLAAGNHGFIIADANSTQLTGTFVLNSLPAVTANITASGPLTFCSGSSVTLTASPGTSYLWNNGATTQSITVTASGSYTVTVTNSNGCSAVSSPLVVTATDVIPPVIANCPGNVTQNTDPGKCGAVVSFSLPPLPPTVDQQITGIYTGTAGSDQWQSFTAGKTGLLTQIDLFHNGCISTSFTLTIYMGTGTSGTVLYSGTYNFPSFCSQWFGIGIPDGSQPNVTAGQTYTFRLQGSGLYFVAGSGGNPGVYYSSDYGTPPWKLNFKSYVQAPSTAITATDNCGVPTLTSNHQSGELFPVGTTQVTYTATDPAGNSSTCSFNVVVTDTEKPLIKTKPAIILLMNGSATLLPSDVDNGSTDNCAISNKTLSKSNFDCSNKGPNNVLFTVTDVNGNSASANVVVTVIDASSPVPNVASLPVITGQCSASVPPIVPTATDGCGAIITATTTNPTVYNTQGTFTINWLYTATNGKTTSQIQQVIVKDNTPPTIPSLPDIIGECTASATVPVAVDNCAGTVTGITNDSLTYSTQGTHVIHWIFNDGNGNVSSAIQNVIIKDNTAPVIPSLPDITGECSASAVAPVASDNCAGNITGSTTDALSYAGQGSYVIHWAFNDGNGNISTAQQNVIVKDKTPPTITCIGDMNVVATSAAGAVVNYTTPVGTDNCSSANTIRTAGLASGSTFPIGTTVVTHTVTDIAGLTATCSFNVTVTGVAPVINVPSSINVINAPGQCGASVSYAGTETTGIPASTITYSIAPGTVFPVGTTSVTATATNALGASSKTFTVTVTDNEKPKFIMPGTASVTIPYLQTPVSSWNAATFNFTDPLPPGAIITSIDLSYSAADQGWGYTGGYTRFYIDGTYIGGNVIADHLVYSLNLNYTGGIPGYVYGGNNSFQFAFEGYPGWQGFFYGGTMTIHYQKNTVPAPISVNTDAGKCGASITLTTPATYDNCIVATVTNNAPSLFPIGTTNVIWTATDIHGNSETAIQTVTVTDNEPPTITAPANVNVNTDLGSNIATNVSLGTPVANDNCGVPTITNDAPASYPLGNTIVTWTVTDIHGLITKASQIVTVTDKEPAAITSLAAIVKNNDPGVCGAIVTYNLPMVSDNVSTTKAVITEGGGDGEIIFDLPLTSNVSNINFSTTGNYKDILHGHGVDIQVNIELFNPVSNSWILIKSIQTGTGDYHFGASSLNFPVISQVSKIRFVASQPVFAAIHLYEMNIALNSISLTRTAGLSSGSSFPVGSTVNTFTAIDMAGNISTTSFTVTVIDAEKPSIVSSALSSTQYAGVNCSWTGSAPSITLTDNCSSTLALTEEYFDAKGNRFYSGTSMVSQGNYTLLPRTFPLGINKIVLTVTDAGGNVSDKTTLILTVVDNTNPTIQPSGNITRSSDPAICGAYVKVPIPVSGDNCSLKSVVNSFNGSANATGQYPVGTTIVTWTVTDESGNKATATQSITVTDNEPPVIMNVPVSISQSSDAGTCGAVVTWAPVMATDNCGVISLISDRQSGETFALGTTTVTFIAKDKNNNIATASFSITVTDNEAPKAITKPITVTLVNGTASILPADLNNGSSDNCGGVTFSANKTTFTCADAGTNLVTLIVTDSHGNSSSATAVVTVIGEVPTSSIQVTPGSAVYTGGVPTDIYLGYGSQTVTLTDNVLGITPITYAWLGSGLSCNNCANPTFAPTAAGGYAFSVTATNKYGCTATSNVFICVRDIRVAPVANSKVYVCHTDLVTGISQTLTLATGLVGNQLLANPQDLLGICGMPACTAAAPAFEKFDPVAPVQIITKDTESKDREGKLSVKVSPNPSNTVFTFIINTQKKNPVQVRLMDEAGRLMEGISNAPIGTSFRMGSKLISGIYFAEVVQGTERVVIKLIKQN